MNDILADYREWRAKQPDRIGTHSDRCHMWARHERCMIHRLAKALEVVRDELASATRHMEMAEAAWLRETAGNSPVAVTLTPEEREAVAQAIGWIESPGVEDEAMPEDYLPITATLRSLLERLT